MKGGCDLTLTIEWQAENDNYTLIGDIKIETLLESMKFYDIETEITILANLEEEEHFGLYDLMKSRGNDEIKSLLARFLKNLKESFINFEGKLEKDKEEKKRESSSEDEPPTPREQNLKRQIKKRKKKRQFQEISENFHDNGIPMISILGYASIVTLLGASIYYIKKKYID